MKKILVILFEEIGDDVAIVKPINSGASLKISIDYVLRGDKTETLLTSGLYCVPEHALEQMNNTKESWCKTDGRQFKHFVQSFHKDENVTADLIHSIGIKFAEKMFPGFEVIISTHKDTDHCHTHFIVNSVNLETGLKIQNSYHDLDFIFSKSSSQGIFRTTSRMGCQPCS